MFLLCHLSLFMIHEKALMFNKKRVFTFKISSTIKEHAWTLMMKHSNTIKKKTLYNSKTSKRFNKNMPLLLLIVPLPSSPRAYRDLTYRVVIFAILGGRRVTGRIIRLYPARCHNPLNCSGTKLVCTSKSLITHVPCARTGSKKPRADR